jgi:hypothetical protein
VSRSIHILVFVFLLAGTSGFSDIIYLKNGKAVEGFVVKLDSQSATVVHEKNQSQIYPRSEIKSIELGSAPPKSSAEPEPNFLSSAKEADSPYATPLHTFQAWKRAASSGDIDGMVNCYASFKQKEKKTELKKLSKDVFEKMRTTTLQTDFVPSAPLYQGDRASMVVNWTKGLDGGEQLLQFILEKKDWKILP